jgi:hypothetical protein
VGGPGLAFETWVFRCKWILAILGVNSFASRNPGLKSETWATHSMSGAALFSAEESWACGPPKRMKNRFHEATALHGSATLPFVIPSEVEGSAVQRTSRGNVLRQSAAQRELALSKIEPGSAVLFPPRVLTSALSHCALFRSDLSHPGPGALAGPQIKVDPFRSN